MPVTPSGCARNQALRLLAGVCSGMIANDMGYLVKQGQKPVLGNDERIGISQKQAAAHEDARPHEIPDLLDVLREFMGRFDVEAPVPVKRAKGAGVE